MGMLGFLAAPLGLIMQTINNLVGNYGVTIILFTLFVRILMIPLAIQQQKSTARMAAFQPMIKEIQKKWGKDQKRANEEVMRFQQENDIKMTGGCLPMAINMIVIFSIIAVIQAPMQYMLNVPAADISNSIAIYNENNEGDDLRATAYTSQSIVIGAIRDHAEWFAEGAEILVPDGEDGEKLEHVKISEDIIKSVQEFEFNFLGWDLSVRPTITVDRYLIMPILSIVTMLLSQFIVMKTSAQQQGQNSMLVMAVISGAMFGWFAFTVPVGFSLYYTVSNVLQTGQQLILRKIISPEDIKEKILQEIEERKKLKKAKKKISVKDEKGNVVTKELSDAEIARIRLAKAREIDAERYKEDPAKEKTAEEAVSEGDVSDEEAEI